LTNSTPVSSEQRSLNVLTDTSHTGQTQVNPNGGGEGSSFLDRERAALGEDAAQFASPHDTKLSTTVEDAGDDDLLGGGNDDFHDAGEMAGFESSFPEIDNTNDVSKNPY
jgi:Clathrin light chain